MIEVRFESFGAGKCMWCQKERADVFEVGFDDKSFSGQMCWTDLKCMIRLRVDQKGDVKTTRIGPPVASAVKGEKP